MASVSLARRPAPAAVSLPAAVVALGLGLLVAGCSSSGSKASADVAIKGCTRDAGDHRAVATGVVHNHSSKTSNYAIQLSVSANDSKLETGAASVLNVDSGATKVFTIRAVGPDIPSGTTLTCKASKIVRVVSP